MTKDSNHDSDFDPIGQHGPVRTEAAGRKVGDVASSPAEPGGLAAAPPSSGLRPCRGALTVVILASFLWTLPAGAAVAVSALQCEYLTDPLGIDVQTPRFTWKLTDTDHARGQKQTGYQVRVASSPARLDEGRADIWDSGKVQSSQSALVPFAGHKLTSGQDCFWKVRVFDKDQKPSAWSSTARFSMGLLEPKDWTGPWIKH